MSTWFGLDPLVAVGLLMLLALTAYVLLAGADFGGGIWDFLATGPRQDEQRLAISKAMGPVWEANHVWLIFLVVILFTVFPLAFRTLSIAFFGIFHLVLVGIVLRGAAFVFRGHADVTSRQWRLWTPIFGAASTITPLLLGFAVGAVSSGGIRLLPGGAVTIDPVLTWLNPVSVLIGLMTVALDAYLAAVYLTVETQGEIREDFRLRALWSGGILFALSAILLVVLPVGSPHLWDHLTLPRSGVMISIGGVLAAASALLVYRRRYKLARLTAMAQVVVLLGGWAFGQWPYIVYPDITFQNATAPLPAVRFLLNTLPFGLALLIPSLYLLFKVFKGEHPKART